MQAMNTGAARVVDPILTEVARGYTNAAHAYEALFPIINVGQRGGRVIAFGAEDFVRRDLSRAPGAARARLEVGYSAEPYALVQRALDGAVPRETLEEAAAVPGINLGTRAVNTVMNTVGLQLEIAAAELASDPKQYRESHQATLAGSSQWSHTESAPAQAVNKAKQIIASGIGRQPNVLILGSEVYTALLDNTDVIERVKYTQGPGAGGAVVTQATLASYFDIETLVVAEARSGEPGAFKPVWGKTVILAYVGVSSLQSAQAGQAEPSYGYTYRLRDYPLVEPAWFDKSNDSWVYPVTCEEKSVIAGKDAGYLFSSVVA